MSTPATSIEELANQEYKWGFVTEIEADTIPEIVQTMADLRRVQCDILTIGQYLQPLPRHLPPMKYYAPEEFAELKRIGLGLGFRHVEAGPLVRSSYHAEQHVPH